VHYGKRALRHAFFAFLPIAIGLGHCVDCGNQFRFGNVIVFHPLGNSALLSFSTAWLAVTLGSGKAVLIWSQVNPSPLAYASAITSQCDCIMQLCAIPIEYKGRALCFTNQAQIHTGKIPLAMERFCNAGKLHALHRLCQWLKVIRRACIGHGTIYNTQFLGAFFTCHCRAAQLVICPQFFQRYNFRILLGKIKSNIFFTFFAVLVMVSIPFQTWLIGFPNANVT
jgi:hypothetical protein